MELKKQLEVKKVKYPESICDIKKRNKVLKGTSLFSTFLFSMLSNSATYATEDETGWGPGWAGGLQTPPDYSRMHITMAVISAITLIIAIISLITTIIYAGKICKLKKKNNTIEDNEDVEKEDKSEIIKRKKKKLIISVVVLILSVVICGICWLI